MAEQAGLPTPTRNEKLYGLDHLRTLAILLVFLFHYGRLFPHPEWVNTISKFGWTGVDLFFVLSGYLIAAQLFAHIAQQGNVPLKSFFLKRFFRIVPAYLFVVALYFCIPYVHEREALAPLWKYLTFTQNLGLDLRTQGTFSHAWSLCIEEQFYLVLPLVLAALLYLKLFRKSFILLAGLFVAGFFIRYFSYRAFVLPGDEQSWASWYKWIYYPTQCRLDGLLTGISIAAGFRFLPAVMLRAARYGNMLLLIGLGILAFAYWLCLDESSLSASVFGFPAVSIGYGFLVTGAVSPGCFLYRWQSRLTARIAALSYALYLIHKITIHVSQDLISRTGLAADSNLMFVICILVTVTAAFIINFSIEQPFMRIRSWLLQKNNYQMLFPGH